MKSSAMHGESGYKRIANDAYFTPTWCTEVLLRHVDFMGTIWEPAAGNGAMVAPLRRAGNDVYATDIDPIHHNIRQADFFEFTGMLPGARNIVTNPPYSCALKFIQHALQLCQNGTVAMLLRNEFDCAASRQNLFQMEACFSMKIVLTRRPRWFADDRASPRHNFAWFIWRKSNRKEMPHIIYDS